MKRKLLGKIMTLKMGYFGHILRGSRIPLTLKIKEGMMDGKRRRRRQKKQWLDNIREWSGMTYTRPSAYHKTEKHRETRSNDVQMYSPIVRCDGRSKDKEDMSEIK